MQLLVYTLAFFNIETVMTGSSCLNKESFNPLKTVSEAGMLYPVSN